MQEIFDNINYQFEKKDDIDIQFQNEPIYSFTLSVDHKLFSNGRKALGITLSITKWKSHLISSFAFPICLQVTESTSQEATAKYLTDFIDKNFKDAAKEGGLKNLFCIYIIVR